MSQPTEKRQIAVLRYIYNHVNEQGYPPTVREICQAVDLSSTSTVHGHLARLEKKGYLQRDPTKPRAIEVTVAGKEVLGIRPHAKQIPVIGTVTAGQPILAVEDTDDFGLAITLGSEGEGVLAPIAAGVLTPVRVSDARRVELGEEYAFSYQCRVDEKRSAVRICTSWATREEDVDRLISDIRRG